MLLCSVCSSQVGRPGCIFIAAADRNIVNKHNILTFLFP